MFTYFLMKYLSSTRCSYGN